MDRWLKLDPTRYVGGRDERSGHASYRALNSPYDIPEAIKYTVDPTTRVLSIDFQYLVNEAPISQSLAGTDEKVRLFTGARSGRLLRIEADLGDFGPLSVQDMTQLAFQMLEFINRHKLQVTSSDVATRVLEDNFQKLVG